MVAGCELAWRKAVRDAEESEQGAVVSRELGGMARTLYVEALRRPVDRVALKHAIETILTFLCTRGRSETNCRAISWFLEVDSDWEGQWRDVPEDLRFIMAQMGAVMSVSDPVKVAAYGASPEQLVARLHRLET
jgi:hypothetical protein